MEVTVEPKDLEAGSARAVRYAPQIFLSVEKLAKGYNVQASVNYAASPEEAFSLVERTMEIASAKYPSSKELEEKAAAERLTVQLAHEAAMNKMAAKFAWYDEQIAALGIVLPEYFTQDQPGDAQAPTEKKGKK